MLKITDLSKSFGGKQVFSGISAEFEKGRIYSITGPSGVGKTTLLRCLTLLEKQDKGTITIDGMPLEDKRLSIGLVFQSFNLFPHMSAIENITFPLIRVKGVSKKDAEAIAMGLLEDLGLQDKADFYEHMLSGGQRQRVAIARAMALAPDFLFFDEPTSALDEDLSESVGNVMLKLKEKGMGIIVITHDLDFAKKISDEVYLLRDTLIRRDLVT
ncbi:amino acid ABC transporter ATP-binding protein [Youngiibacter multivorans]|uniref:Polar amino acid transport system ATP-binding protein n=1 Tax=Youngiibacter multivorans TaxID=937251 RepID=A0ABS4G231_9CLOT|nr:ATP-binding cassette domain-containing protein [Youngiibacter multivorans]MBP1918603.1 polar amino acid transport system ATP-binding protein [Youngiibacter multivorans]